MHFYLLIVGGSPVTVAFEIGSVSVQIYNNRCNWVCALLPPDPEHTFSSKPVEQSGIPLQTSELFTHSVPPKLQLTNLGGHPIMKPE